MAKTGAPNGKPVYESFHGQAYYDPDEHVTVSSGPSLTRQEFAQECDINHIMSQYVTDGMVPGMFNNAPPKYLDLTSGFIPTDLATAMRVVDDARVGFMSLPAKVRREFDHDPVKFVDFASDPANIDQLRDWGLAPPPPPPVKEDPPVVPPVASPPVAPAEPAVRPGA